MLRVRVMSDLHLNQDPWYDVFIPPTTEMDRGTVLVLAGDIWDSCGHLEVRPEFDDRSWLACVAGMFRSVVMVTGNHEYWRKVPTTHTTTVDSVDAYVREELCSQGLHNVWFNEDVLIDDVLFLCGTMWTDLDGGDPLLMMRRVSGLGNDCSMIRGFTPEEEVERHRRFMDHLIYSLAEDRQCRTPRRRVVVTHHAPTRLSIHERFRYGPASTANAMFCNDLDLSAPHFHGLNLWIHGHTHNRFDYTIGDVRVVCNPRGHPHDRGNVFDPLMTLEV